MGSYDSYAEQYNGMVNSGGPVGSYKYILQQLKNLSVLADLRICDIGCGQGELAYRLSELGAKVTGVDLSENLLVYARNLNSVTPRFPSSLPKPPVASTECTP